jgi:hypothetical protein
MTNWRERKNIYIFLLVRDRKIIYLEIKFSNKMRNIAT